MIWLKNNYKIILLISIPVLLAIDILTRYLFILHLDFDSTVFNNVITPIGTVISSILFFYALSLTIKQNIVIESQNLKPNFEREFERIRAVLSEEGMIHKIREGDKPVTLLNVHISLWQVWHALHEAEYFIDLAEFEKGNKQPQNYYYGRKYFPELMFFYRLDFLGLWDYEQVLEFISEVESSRLNPDDKAYFKKRVKNEFVGKFVGALGSYFGEVKPFLSPKINVSGNPQALIEYEMFEASTILKYYHAFKKSLY